MNNTKQALIWITDIIKKHNIPFQIAGGLAVRAYGSTRKLADIDIDIPEEDFKKIETEVAPYITFGPEYFKDDNWEMLLMSLSYCEQEIDLSGAFNTKVYNKKNKSWEKLKTDFSNVEYLNVCGINLPIINRDALIAYKKLLARPVDILDVEYLEQR